MLDNVVQHEASRSFAVMPHDCIFLLAILTYMIHCIHDNSGGARM